MNIRQLFSSGSNEKLPLRPYQYFLAIDIAPGNGRVDEYRWIINLN